MFSQGTSWWYTTLTLSRSLMVELSPYTCGVYMFSQGPSWKNSQLTCGVYILSRGPLYGGNSRLLNMLCMFSHKVTHGGPCQPLHFFVSSMRAVVNLCVHRKTYKNRKSYMYTTQLSSSMCLASWLSFRCPSWWSSSPSWCLVSSEHLASPSALACLW